MASISDGVCLLSKEVDDEHRRGEKEEGVKTEGIKRGERGDAFTVEQETKKKGLRRGACAWGRARVNPDQSVLLCNHAFMMQVPHSDRAEGVS
jgi:hypothetical protein